MAARPSISRKPVIVDRCIDCRGCIFVYRGSCFNQNSRFQCHQGLFQRIRFRSCFNVHLSTTWFDSLTPVCYKKRIKYDIAIIIVSSDSLIVFAWMQYNLMSVNREWDQLLNGCFCVRNTRFGINIDRGTLGVQKVGLFILQGLARLRFCQ